MSRRRKSHHVYEGIKAAAIQRNRAASRVARDIGSIPPVSDPSRRRHAFGDFQFFCREYFGHLFTLPSSQDQVRVDQKIQSAIEHGGKFAFVMPRSRGKTTRSEIAAMWAAMTGRHFFVMLIGANKDAAEQMLDHIRTELMFNDALNEDFPEICYPIRELDGEPRRAIGQLHHGRHTKITIGAESIVFPTIPGSQASGAKTHTAGLLGGIRGAKHNTLDGRSIRPSLAVIDDPQTDESASSPAQTEHRERIIQGAIDGLEGPTERLAALMPCTIIRPDDLAARMLDKEQHPDWNGERFQQLKSFPDRMDLWEKYDEIRREDLANDLQNTPNAHKLYGDNRREMDRGAVVDWPDAIKPGDLSALESTMRKFLADPYAFACECQNDPPKDHAIEKEFLTAPEIAKRVNAVARRQIPNATTKLVAAIDVQKDLLYWGMVGVAPDMSAGITDYGTWPEQSRSYFTLARAHPTIGIEYSGRLESRLFASLTDLIDMLTGQVWQREDGGLAHVDRVVIDANWKESTDIIYEICNHHAMAPLLTPCHGRYIGATTREINDRKKKKGDIVGHHWRSPAVNRGQPVRYVSYDSNYWKTFVQNRLAQPDEDPGAWRLYAAKPSRHRMIADHLTSERPVPVEANERRVIEWKLPPNKPDNHLLDVVVMSAVAASVEGCILPEHQRQAKPKRKRSRKAKRL